ncbi:hypothetical protein RQP54_03935 [Curvibacter sp. APW13]|uniref:hypothetical protein n=1 Tax=Curvibacter sp. APW13 TaxID=3077236 RepID=UPI0028DD9D2E|nr:hypothetical protein [Curvibacter sp. APW13]MDT8990003.1 hypothetical protein [Curvibacter sp. APW13]
MKIALRIAFLLLVVVPLAAWFVVKPVRVMAPTASGMQCTSHAVCVESADRLAEATALRDDALAFVANNVGPTQGEPLVVFCETQDCADRFGLGARSAVTVGTVGTVVGPSAWKDYYVRHELIHHLQGQQFGVLRRILMPSWLIEGMAYALSEDPRDTLAEPWQQYRSAFQQWRAGVGRENMWASARSL